MALTRLGPSARHSAPDPTKALQILYVEDEDTNWDVTLLALGKMHTLTRARNAQETFELLTRTKFDLILMDIQLGGSDLNGIEITQVLKGKYPKEPPAQAKGASTHNAPIVFVTAYSARYQRAELLAMGADEVVSKPVDFTRLNLVSARLVTRR